MSNLDDITDRDMWHRDKYVFLIEFWMKFFDEINAYPVLMKKTAEYLVEWVAMFIWRNV